MISTASDVSGLFLVLGIVSLPERMNGGVEPEPLPAGDHQLDFARWDLGLLREPVGNDHGILAREEIKQPVVDMAQPDSQLVDPIPEQVGLGAAKLVPQRRK